MTRVTTDTLDGGGSLRRTADGYEDERVVLVRELTGTPEARKHTALTAPGVPQVGDPHPVIPGLIVTSADAQLLDGSQATVTINYANQPGGGTLRDGVVSIEVSSTTSDEETSVDRDGNIMTNHYESWASATGIPQYDGLYGVYITTDRIVKAQIKRSQLQVRITVDTDRHPRAIIQKYLNTINRAPWSGFAAETWFCSGIDAQPKGSGWRLVYQFTWRQEGWQLTDIVEMFGLNPINVAEGNGIAHYDLFRPENWAGLPSW